MGQCSEDGIRNKINEVATYLGYEETIIGLIEDDEAVKAGAISKE